MLIKKLKRLGPAVGCVFRSIAHWRFRVNGNIFSADGNAARVVARPAVGHALRKDLYAKVSAILVGSNEITDSNTRLLIQASCLDLVSALEDVIQRFGLDESLQ